MSPRPLELKVVWVVVLGEQAVEVRRRMAATVCVCVREGKAREEKETRRRISTLRARQRVQTLEKGDSDARER